MGEFYCRWKKKNLINIIRLSKIVVEAYDSLYVGMKKNTKYIPGVVYELLKQNEENNAIL